MPLYTSYSEETQTQIEEFLENTWNYDEDELVEFIEKHGEESFKLYFEDYVDMIDKVGSEVVEAFLENFDIADISNLEDFYQGQYNSGAEFAQMIAEDCGDIGRNMAGWIEIDWEASWNNLSYDYVECGDGHIFGNY